MLLRMWPWQWIWWQSIHLQTHKWHQVRQNKTYFWNPTHALCITQHTWRYRPWDRSVEILKFVSQESATQAFTYQPPPSPLTPKTEPPHPTFKERREFEPIKKNQVTHEISQLHCWQKRKKKGGW